MNVKCLNKAYTKSFAQKVSLKNMNYELVREIKEDNEYTILHIYDL